MAFVTTAIEERGGFVVFESEGDGNGGGDWLGEETSDGGAWWKKMTTLLAELLRVKTSMFQLAVNTRFVEGSLVRMYEHRRE